MQAEIQGIESKSTKEDTRLEGIVREIIEEVNNRPSIDEYKLRNGSTLQQEMDRLAFLVGETRGIILKIRGDQVQSLASNTLCLSCGRGDVNFLPPMEMVKGSNGQFYRAGSTNQKEFYDIGTYLFIEQASMFLPKKRLPKSTTPMRIFPSILSCKEMWISLIEKEVGIVQFLIKRNRVFCGKHLEVGNKNDSRKYTSSTKRNNLRTQSGVFLKNRGILHSKVLKATKS